MAWIKTWRHAAVGLILFAACLGYGQLRPWLDRERAMTEETARLVAQQTMLAHYEAVTADINTALHDGLASNPGLDRIRVAFIQAPATRDNLPLLRWDFTNSLTKPGHTIGALATNLNLSDWSDFFEVLLAHKCGRIDMAAMSSEATKIRISEMHLAGVIVCPIATRRGELVGALFGSWDIGSPEPPDLDATEALLFVVANRIGAVVPLGR